MTASTYRGWIIRPPLGLAFPPLIFERADFGGEPENCGWGETEADCRRQIDEMEEGIMQ